MTSASAFETELSSLIDLVDAEWYHSEDWIRFQVMGPIVIGFGFGLWATFIYFRALPGGVSVETLSLIIAAIALEVSLVYAIDYSARFRQIRAWTHFNNLKNKTSDLLVLTALIKMRASLSLMVTLKSVYARDRGKSMFSEESLL